MAVHLTHRELSLLVFALEGPPAIDKPASPPACEEACPVTSHFEQLFGGNEIDPEQQLIRHLNNHLREALFECGMLDLMGAFEHAPAKPLSQEESLKLQQMNARLSEWSCEIDLDSAERNMLLGALSELPRGAWLSMPRTIWRLRKKLRLSSRD